MAAARAALHGVIEVVNPHDGRPSAHTPTPEGPGEAAPPARPANLQEVIEAEYGCLGLVADSGRPGADQARRDGQCVVGLALSGGGVRSAAFSLGVVQALEACGIYKSIHYLSTVSGGGFTGASLVAGLMRDDMAFPFSVSAAVAATRADHRGGDPGGAADVADSQLVCALRDRSRYLMPKGRFDLVVSLGIILRGLAVNVVLVASLVFGMAAITLAFNPDGVSLRTAWIGEMILRTGVVPEGGAAGRWLLESPLLLTQAGAILLFVFLVVWAIWRSVLPFGRKETRAAYRAKEAAPAPRWSEPASPASRIAAWSLIVLLAVAVCDVQSQILKLVIEVLSSDGGDGKIPFFSDAVAALAVGTGILGIAWRALVSMLQSASADPYWKGVFKAIIARAMLYALALALPLLIYVVYLWLALVGVAHPEGVLGGSAAAGAAYPYAPAPFVSLAADFRPLVWIFLICWFVGVSAGLWRAAVGSLWRSFAQIARRRSLTRPEAEAAMTLAAYLAALVAPIAIGAYWLLPYVVVAPVLLAASVLVAGSGDGRTAGRRRRAAAAIAVVWAAALGLVTLAVVRGGVEMAIVYGCISGILAAFGFQFTENATSLHRLYRDRLEESFVIRRNGPAEKDPSAAPISLTELDEFYRKNPGAPYLLVNAAMNIQGSKSGNRRARNADFFLVSAKFVGSNTTGYAPTDAYQAAEPGLDLATAVAMSAAAVSSSMGRVGIAMLSPTLALLNLRLGYWLRNPMYAMTAESRAAAEKDDWKLFYLFNEAFGLLDEQMPKSYVTDGGHIDNLGLYQLLQRRCDVIIVSDAEADGGMTFTALTDVERFARIDLGIRIDIDWTPIRDAANARSVAMRNHAPGAPAPHSPPSCHAAIGRILYPEKTDGTPEKEGLLVYIKAAVTGDEPTYVLDYERRYPSFPHESTGDQFFSEEQFEAYRALGFHAARDAFRRYDGTPQGLERLDRLRAKVVMVEKWPRPLSRAT